MNVLFWSQNRYFKIGNEPSIPDVPDPNNTYTV